MLLTSYSPPGLAAIQMTPNNGLPTGGLPGGGLPSGGSPTPLPPATPISPTAPVGPAPGAPTSAARTPAPVVVVGVQYPTSGNPIQDLHVALGALAEVTRNRAFVPVNVRDHRVVQAYAASPYARGSTAPQDVSVHTVRAVVAALPLLTGTGTFKIDPRVAAVLVDSAQSNPGIAIQRVRRAARDLYGAIRKFLGSRWPMKYIVDDQVRVMTAPAPAPQAVPVPQPVPQPQAQPLSPPVKEDAKPMPESQEAAKPTPAPTPAPEPLPEVLPEPPPAPTPPQAVAKYRYGCVARFNKTRKIYSIYCPVDTSLGYSYYGALADDTLTPSAEPAPAGTAKEGEEAIPPRCETADGSGSEPCQVTADQERDAGFWRLHNPWMWLTLGGAAAVAGSTAVLVYRRRSRR